MKGSSPERVLAPRPPVSGTLKVTRPRLFRRLVIAQRDELAEQAVRAAYAGGERPKGFQVQVYLPVDCR